MAVIVGITLWSCAMLIWGAVLAGRALDHKYQREADERQARAQWVAAPGGVARLKGLLLNNTTASADRSATERAAAETGR